MEITAETFDALLSWLDPEREAAGQKYELIRMGLVRMYVSKGFNDAEDLADEVINRVMSRLPEIREEYTGEPVRYFHGVARNLVFERHRRKEVNTEVLLVSPPPVERTAEAECLRKCLKLLSPQKRELILDYYLNKGHEKVELHRSMAAELSITEGALRSRAFQLRTSLEKCVRQCVGNRLKQNRAPKS